MANGGNAFVNDGGFLARFLAAQQQTGDGAAPAEDPRGAVAVAGHERVRASVARNDGSFVAAYLALQREAATASGETHAEGEGEAAGTGGSGTPDASQPRRKKRRRWDAGPTASAPATAAKKEQRSALGKDADADADVDADEALRDARAKQQKRRGELRFLEQRVRGLQQQAVASTAVGKGGEADAALAEERRREYGRLAERDGTREHRQRAQEMLETLETAAAATVRAEGKHHLGDFLPVGELGQLGQQRRPAGGVAGAQDGDDEFDQYRKRMMLAYRFRPNPLNNPRRSYY